MNLGRGWDIGTAGEGEDLGEAILRVGQGAGLEAVGITGAHPFVEARQALEEGRRSGRDGGMQFTYRNPARSTDPSRILSGAQSLVVGAMSYRQSVPPSPPGPHARVARYATGDTYAALRSALGVLRRVLVERGHRAIVVADDNALVDRAAAFRSGIGWLGKNTNLLVPGRGSWFVLGSVVTDARLGETPAAPGGGCGSCSRCLDRCPTGALVAPGVLDGRRCLAWLVQAPGSIPEEYRVALGDRLYGCDDCQEVCPPNRGAPAGPGRGPGPATEPPPGEDPGPWVDVIDLLGADDRTLIERFGRWYIADRDPDVLRRNALVVLGNVGDGTTPEVEDVLVRYLGSGNPVLVEHASWAARRLGRGDLLDR